MKSVLVRCDRCKNSVNGIQDDFCTGGFYEASAWLKYTNPGEDIICDDCMHSDPRYIEDFGHIRPNLNSRA